MPAHDGNASAHRRPSDIPLRGAADVLAIDVADDCDAGARVTGGAMSSGVGGLMLRTRHHYNACMVGPRQLALSLFTLTSIAFAQAPQWRPHPPGQTGGGVVEGLGVACDHLRNRIVVFGGVSGHVPYNNTFELDGDTWTAINTANPSPAARWACGLVFDSRRGETVLFGGVTFGAVFADTWTWDGTAWTQRFPRHSPPAGLGTMVYDEDRGVAVLYAGQTMWEWNGVDWQERTPVHAPPVRAYTSMAFDSRRGHVVLFGGMTVTGSTTSWPTDTWEWDGTDWQQVPVTLPGSPAVFQPMMVFDRERGRCVMTCTSATGPRCYEYDGTAWTTAAALPWETSMLVADRQRNRIVASVRSPLNQTPTWSYETTGLAVAQPFGVGCGNPALAVRQDPNARPLLGQTLSVGIDNAPTGLAFMCFGWSNRQVLSLHLPMRMDVFGLPTCWLLQSDDLITLGCANTGPTTARFDLPIPPAPMFAGMRFYLQPWAPAPGSNPAGAVIGDGLAVVLGTH